MYKYNPLLVGKLDRVGVDKLNDLADVNTAGTVNGYVLTYGTTLDTWTPKAAGAGDMQKSVYDIGDDGVVDNSERLEGETLATVQAHTVDAMNILGTIADAQIPDVETLSYSVPFADGQIPTLDATKIISGTFDAGQIPDLPTSRIATGTFVADRIPTMGDLKGTVPDEKIPNLETLSYGAAFADAQIPNLAASKITTGTFNANRIPALPTSRITSGTFNVNRIDTIDNLKGTVTAEKVASLSASKTTSGTFGLARIPAVDDARIPDLETLSYGGTFATAQIPNLDTSKITSGTLAVARHETLDNLNGTVALLQVPTMDDAHIPDLETLSYGAAFAEGQIPNLPTTKITSGTLGLARIPSIDNAHLAGDITSDKISALDGTAVTYPLDANSIGTTQIKSGGVENAELAASGLDIAKFTVGTAGLARIPALPTARITTGTFGLARIPSVDDARIPDVDTLSYSGAFGTAQIPNLSASKITAGTIGLARIPAVDDARIPDLETLSYGGAFAVAQIPDLAASKTTTGTFNANRIPVLPSSRITTGTFNADRVPILPTDRYGSAVLLTGAQSIGGTKTFTDIPILPASDPTADNEAARKAYVDAQVEYHPYIGDETQVETVSGTYQGIKNFHFVKHGSVVSPSTIRVACEVKTTAGSYQMQIIVGSGTAMTLSGTESAYKLRYGDYGLGGAATGVVEVRAKLRNIGAGTTYNRLYDNYLKY